MIYNKLLNIFWTLISRIYYKLIGVTIGKGVIFKKKPSIYKNNTSKISIGNNVMLNSNNYRYHINMHSACKLLADGENSQIIIGANSRIHGTCIHAKKSIVIGKNCLIAANTQIMDSNAHYPSFDNVDNRINTFDNGKAITIEDNVWIGANCYILPGVIIGEGSIISANSVVIKDVPKMCLAGGNPAKIIKQY